jgi:hypothetical protein
MRAWVWRCARFALVLITVTVPAANAQLLKFAPTKDHAGDPHGDLRWLDALLPTGHVGHNIEVGTSSPPNGELVRVATFDADQRLKTVQILRLTGIDASGMSLTLVQVRCRARDAAAYDHNAASMLTSNTDIPAGLTATIRALAIAGVLNQSIGRRDAPPLTTSEFRLPLPPTAWALDTDWGPLRFRLERPDSTSATVTAYTLIPKGALLPPR